MARPRLGDTASKRLQMVITEEELNAVDEWQFRNRVPSRSEAMRRLVQIGILVEEELEQIVDVATDALEKLTEQLSDAVELERALLAPHLSDALFTQDQLRDVLGVWTKHNLYALEAMEAVQLMNTTLYNAIVPIVDAASIKSGLEEAQSRFDEANAANETAQAKRAAMQENRYLSLIALANSPAEEERYEALSETEKDEFLAKKIEQLRQEEIADPDAFASKYGLRYFWEHGDWRANVSRKNDRTSE